jgi:hypothetical protein
MRDRKYSLLCVHDSLIVSLYKAAVLIKSGRTKKKFLYYYTYLQYSLSAAQFESVQY